MPVDLPAEVHERNVRRIRDLLDKFRLEKRLLYAATQERHDLEEGLVVRQQAAELERQLAGFHVADLAALMTNLPDEDRQNVWSHMPATRRGDVFCELDEAVRARVIRDTPQSDLENLLLQLDADDLSLVADELPGDVLEQTLARRQSVERDWVKEALSFPDDCCGHWMSRDLICVRRQQTLEQVHTQLTTLKALPLHTDKLFVTDARGILVGALYLQELLLTPMDTLVETVMKTQVAQFTPEDDMEDIARAFEKYDLISAPVVNDRGKVLGRLTVDLLMDYVRESTDMAALNAAGVSETEDLFAGIWSSARNRWLWLAVNLCSAFIISRIIGIFEGTITQLVALASLMPIVASVAGNTGNQTAAIVIRGLATRHIQLGNAWYVLRKELAISALNGAVWGMVVGLFAFVFYQDFKLSLVVTSALALTFLLAALVGAGAPMLLEAKGRDPAKGTSVIVTGVTDAMGFLIFLSMATAILIG